MLNNRAPWPVTGGPKLGGEGDERARVKRQSDYSHAPVVCVVHSRIQGECLGRSTDILVYRRVLDDVELIRHANPDFDLRDIHIMGLSYEMI